MNNVLNERQKRFINSAIKFLSKHGAEAKFKDYTHLEFVLFFGTTTMDHFKFTIDFETDYCIKLMKKNPNNDSVTVDPDFIEKAIKPHLHDFLLLWLENDYETIANRFDQAVIGGDKYGFFGNL